MRNALMTLFIMTAIYGHANTDDKKRDTIYTNVSTLLNVLNTTKKKSATYYLVLNTNDSSQVKVRIDFERLKADIPLYASNTTDFDIKKLLSLKKDDVDEATKKLEDFDAKAKKQTSLVNEFKALEKELANLKAVDSINIDSIAIANTAEKIKIKKSEASQLKKEYDKLFTEYKELQNSLIGNLRSDYQNRITKAIEEAYEKLENKEIKFQTFDDDAWLYDIRINLVKVDATRKMKVQYRRNGGGNATEDISAGKTYFISHFAEFGAFYEEEQLISIFNTIKTSEVKRNPYLLDKPFALVTDNKDLTQHYINTVIDYKNYKGEVEETSEILIIRIYANGKIVKFVPKKIQEEYKKQFDVGANGKKLPIQYEYYDAFGNKKDLGAYEYFLVPNPEKDHRWSERNYVDLIDIRTIKQEGFKIVLDPIQNRSERYYLNPSALGSLWGVALELGYTDIDFRGFSQKNGKAGKSNTHYNGYYGDFGYFCKDFSRHSLSLKKKESHVGSKGQNYYGWSQMDEARQNKFNDALFKFGWKNGFWSWEYDDKYLNHSTQYDNHDHHLHLKYKYHCLNENCTKYEK